MQRVRRQNLDQVEIAAQQILEVAGRTRLGMLGCAAGEQGGIGLAQRGDLRLRMAEVATHVEIEYAAKPDEADAQLACHVAV